MDPAPPTPLEPKRVGTGALVCGIIGLIPCLGSLFTIPAIVFGHLGHSAAGKSGGTIVGEQKSMAGFILGYIGIVVNVIVGIPMLAALLIPALSAGRNAARQTQSMNNARMVHLALLELEGDSGKWPAFADVSDPDALEFATSTDLFRHLVAKDMVGDFTYFAGAGAKPPVLAAHPETFTDAHNGWSVASPSSDHRECPVLLSRNIIVTSLDQLNGPVRDTLDQQHPDRFYRNNATIILRDGVTIKIKAAQQWEHLLSGPFEGPVMRP